MIHSGKNEKFALLRNNLTMHFISGSIQESRLKQTIPPLHPENKPWLLFPVLNPTGRSQCDTFRRRTLVEYGKCFRRAKLYGLVRNDDGSDLDYSPA